MNNLLALSNPVARLKRQDAKAKSRWAIAAEQQWENMLRDAAENSCQMNCPLSPCFSFGQSKLILTLPRGVMLFLILPHGRPSSEANPFGTRLRDQDCHTCLRLHPRFPGNDMN
jgi:hypothetical protein